MCNRNQRTHSDFPCLLLIFQNVFFSMFFVPLPKWIFKVPETLLLLRLIPEKNGLLQRYFPKKTFILVRPSPPKRLYMTCSYTTVISISISLTALLFLVALFLCDDLNVTNYLSFFWRDFPPQLKFMAWCTGIWGMLLIQNNRLLDW